MVKFERYPHVGELIKYYAGEMERKDIALLLENGIATEEDARVFSTFVWDVVERVHCDEEEGVDVLGGVDNTEMLPDLSYEVTKMMKSNGFYSVWESVSRDQM